MTGSEVWGSSHLGEDGQAVRYRPGRTAHVGSPAEPDAGAHPAARANRRAARDPARPAGRSDRRRLLDVLRMTASPVSSGAKPSTATGSSCRENQGGQGSRVPTNQRPGEPTPPLEVGSPAADRRRNSSRRRHGPPSCDLVYTPPRGEPGPFSTARSNVARAAPAAVWAAVWLVHGSAHDPESLAGATHLVEHLTLRRCGAFDRASLARLVDRLGGDADAWTGPAMCLSIETTRRRPRQRPRPAGQSVRADPDLRSRRRRARAQGDAGRARADARRPCRPGRGGRAPRCLGAAGAARPVIGTARSLRRLGPQRCAVTTQSLVRSGGMLAAVAGDVDTGRCRRRTVPPSADRASCGPGRCRRGQHGDHLAIHRERSTRSMRVWCFRPSPPATRGCGPDRAQPDARCRRLEPPLSAPARGGGADLRQLVRAWCCARWVAWSRSAGRPRRPSSRMSSGSCARGAEADRGYLRRRGRGRSGGPRCEG